MENAIPVRRKSSLFMIEINSIDYNPLIKALRCNINPKYQNISGTKK
jgi:hypothetical protein